jgi:hypothetical protein
MKKGRKTDFKEPTADILQLGLTFSRLARLFEVKLHFYLNF